MASRYRASKVTTQSPHNSLSSYRSERASPPGSSCFYAVSLGGGNVALVLRSLRSQHSTYPVPPGSSGEMAIVEAAKALLNSANPFHSRLFPKTLYNTIRAKNKAAKFSSFGREEEEGSPRPCAHIVWLSTQCRLKVVSSCESGPLIQAGAWWRDGFANQRCNYRRAGQRVMCVVRM